MFTLEWTTPATTTYQQLKAAAEASLKARKANKKTKASKQEGLFKQVAKSIQYLALNSSHPSLNTHEYDSVVNPYDPKAKVFEAYAQNNTPGACRVFWCYGPKEKQITIIAITPHP